MEWTRLESNTGLSPGEARRLNFQHMDRVRFGRALGYGARHAMKTLVTAVDAATAEDPSSKRAKPGADSDQAATAPLLEDGRDPHGPTGSTPISRTGPDCQSRPSDGEDCGPGAGQAAGIAARHPPFRRRGVEAICAALRSAWTRGFGRLLRNLCDGCAGGSGAAARELAPT